MSVSVSLLYVLNIVVDLTLICISIEYHGLMNYLKNLKLDAKGEGGHHGTLFPS